MYLVYLPESCFSSQGIKSPATTSQEFRENCVLGPEEMFDNMENLKWEQTSKNSSKYSVLVSKTCRTLYIAFCGKLRQVKTKCIEPDMCSSVVRNTLGQQDRNCFPHTHTSGSTEMHDEYWTGGVMESPHWVPSRRLVLFLEIDSRWWRRRTCVHLLLGSN